MQSDDSHKPTTLSNDTFCFRQTGWQRILTLIKSFFFLFFCCSNSTVEEKTKQHSVPPQLDDGRKGHLNQTESHQNKMNQIKRYYSHSAKKKMRNSSFIQKKKTAPNEKENKIKAKNVHAFNWGTEVKMDTLIKQKMTMTIRQTAIIRTICEEKLRKKWPIFLFPMINLNLMLSKLL